MSLPEDGPSGQSSLDAAVPDPLRAAFEALRSVEHVLVRPTSSLGGSGDVDLLVDVGSLAPAVDALRAIGFERLDHGDPADAHLVAHDPVAGGFVWLHLQTCIRAPGIELDTATLLGSAGLEDEIPVVADEWLFWVLVVHTLFTTGRVSAKHRDTLVETATAARATVPAVRRAIARSGSDAARLVDAVATHDWDSVDALAAPLPRPVPLAERVRGRLLQVRRLARRRGLSVAAIGPDGAGKTSLVEGLERSLPFPTARMYLGLTGGRLPLADRLRVPGLVFSARLALLWIRHAVVVVHRRRGRIVLLDRHVLDGRVPSGVRLGPLRRRARLLESRLVPAPDVLIVLDAPGDLLHVRSGEYDAETLESWRRAYTSVADQVPGAVVLDATRPAEDVLRDAEHAVWVAATGLRQSSRSRPRVRKP